MVQLSKTAKEAMRVSDSDADDDLSLNESIKSLGYWVTIVFTGLCIYNVMAGDPLALRLSLLGLWLCFYAAGEWVRRLGRLRLATWLMTLGGWSTIVAIQWLSGGIQSPGMGAHVMVMLIGGLLGGPRVAMGLGALSIGSTAAMWFADAHQWVAPRMLGLRASAIFGHQAGILLLSILGVSIAMSRLDKAKKMASERRVAAEESMEGFKELFVKSPAPMALTEANLRQGETVRRAMAANNAFEALFEIDKKDAIETPGAQINLWCDLAELVAVRDLLSENGHVERFKARMRTWGKKESRVCLVSAKPVMYDAVPAILWTFQDLTEIEGLSSKLAAANDDLERRVQAKAMELERARQELGRQESLARLGEMVAGVAHEINTPIGNAMLSASTLSESSQKLVALASGPSLSRNELARLSGRIQEAGEIAMENLEKAGEIIRNFKQLSADQAGQARREFMLGEVIGGAIKAMGPALRAKKVVANVQGSEEAKLTKLDSYPGALSQIVTALASNALDHAFDGLDGEQQRTFQVDVRVGEGMARIGFEDNGAGIDPAVGLRMFEPFYTTKHGKGGTGLGLAVSWGLAGEALGGELAWVPGKGGARFELSIPLEAPSRSEASKA